MWACSIQNQAPVSPIIVTTVAQAIQLNNREFTCSPISSFLFTRMSMNTSTNGNSTPFSTCERTVILSRGKFGHKMTPAPRAIKAV